jgi:hypothetical protein
MAAAVLAVLVVGIVARRWTLLGGGLAAIGAIWTVLFGTSAVNCAGPGEPCGATPIDLTPHLVISIGLIVVGALVAVLPLARGRSPVA